MVIEDKLIKEYPLTKKIESSFKCFEITKRRYVVFFYEKINRDNMESLLDVFNDVLNLTSKKTLIIVGYTDEQFKKEDLVFFNGADTFVVYYLLNENNNEIYFNDQGTFFFGVNWKKIIKRFNEIMKS